MTPIILIPAYNEVATIGNVVTDAILISGWPVLVIDDASIDDTIKRAECAGAMILPLVTNLGSWGAMQTGIRYAVELNAPIVVTMDGDGQHQAKCIPALIAPIIAGIADVTIGAHIKRANGAKHLAWQFFRIITGLKIEDLTSGFRGYNNKALLVLASSNATLLDYQDIGVLMLLREAGLRFIEVEVEMRPRTNGTSRIFTSWLQVARYIAITLILCIGKWDRHLR